MVPVNIIIHEEYRANGQDEFSLCELVCELKKILDNPAQGGKKTKQKLSTILIENIFVIYVLK